MEDRLNVILDLDNTIINALEEHERQKIPNDIQSQYDYKDMATYGYRIFGRPGLQEFLDFLFDNFNVSVFTAAEQEYALFIVNNFLLTKPGRKVHNILFRYHVDIALKRYDGMKDLRLLFDIFKLPNFYPCNTVIIDDLEDVRQANPLHTIQIKSFDVAKDGNTIFESIEDSDLKRIQQILTRLNERFKNSNCPREIYLGQQPKLESPFFL